MLDQESDETFVGTERRPMNADRNFLEVVAIFVAKIETARLRKIDLVGGQGEFASDYAPHLHIDFWTIKRGLVRHFNIIDSRILEYVPRHLLGLFPKFRFVNKLLSEFRRIVR